MQPVEMTATTVNVRLTPREWRQWQSKNNQLARTAFERRMAEEGYTLTRSVDGLLSFTIDTAKAPSDPWQYADTTMGGTWQGCLTSSS